jgi:predicted acetyltransferase
VDISIRGIAPSEFDRFLDALAVSFSGQIRPEEADSIRKITEIERVLVAIDGEEFVGGAAASSFELTVPGAVVRAAGITGVGVKPTHRRRGVNSALMRRQLDDIHGAGETIAILNTSEGGIYGRFGYGIASSACEIDIERDRTRFVRGVRPSGEVGLLEREAALAAFPDVYERVRLETPGFLARNEAWWDDRFRDFEFDREGASAYFYALHESEGSLDAYAVYRVKHDWVESVPRSTLSVEELIGATPQGYADMWRYCFDVDLVHRIKAWNRPEDEPLYHLLEEPRRLGLRTRDGVWARLVDVPQALAQRRYSVEGRTIFEVHDEFCPWNDGNYALQGGPDGAECSTTAEDPDVVLSATELGAAYLGGTSFRRLGRAGRLVEGRGGGLKRADSLFAWDRAPWCPQMF